MLCEQDAINKPTVGYGSIIPTKSKYKSRSCKSQIIFIILLLIGSILCITFSIYPTKKKLPQQIQEIDTTSCETHICLYELTSIPDIDITNPQIQLFENHPTTIKGSSKFAFINNRKFQSAPDILTITHAEGNTVSLPLKAYKTNELPNGLHYFADEFDNRFLLNMHTDSSYLKIEGYGSCNDQKFEIHSIDSISNNAIYLLIEKTWIQDTTNWCGILDINTKYTPIQNVAATDTVDDIDDVTEDIAIWLSTNNMITNHIGLDELFINKGVINDAFIIEPLCSDKSIYDGFVYCLYPDSNQWDEFDTLKFYQYGLDGSLWNELSDFPLDIGDSSVNIPRSMVVMTDNEIYAFAVNPTDLMINVYSFTTAWRLHHYTPDIGGDIDKVEIDSIFVNDIMYFSINEYDPIGVYSVYHYIDDIFAVFETFNKIEVPIYSHCLTEFDDVLLTYYVDYGHNLWAYYDSVRYNMEFNIANQIQTNQFKCILTEKGNIISWKMDTIVYYIHTAIDDFKVIDTYARLPWNIDDDSKGNLFQLIVMRDSINDYKSVSVYYTNDIMDNYVTDFDMLSMDISAIVSLSNIIYGINNNYKYMMRLNMILVYNDDVDTFTSYDQDEESDINILLVDKMNDDDDGIGYSQCNDDEQSFAVVEYTIF
eukprot:212001_1